MHSHLFFSSTLFLLLSCVPSASFANSSLEKLKQQLISFKGKSEISASLFTQEKRTRDGKDIKEGEVTVMLRDGSNGFLLGYSPEVLRKINNEQQAEFEQKKLIKEGLKVTEPVKTPTLTAMNFLRPLSLRAFVSKSQGLLNFIEQLAFISEEEHNGLKLLTFTVDMETIVSDKKAREYVDEFEGNYKLWVNEQGNPVKGELLYQGSGTAYLIFTIEVKQSITEHYQVVGDRLIVTENHYDNKNTHTFGSMHFQHAKYLEVVTSKSKPQNTASIFSAL